MISRATAPAPLAGQDSKETLSGPGSVRAGTSVAGALACFFCAMGGSGTGAARTFGDASIILPGAPTSIYGNSCASADASATGAAGFVSAGTGAFGAVASA